MTADNRAVAAEHLDLRARADFALDDAVRDPDFGPGLDVGVFDEFGSDRARGDDLGLTQDAVPHTDAGARLDRAAIDIAMDLHVAVSLQPEARAHVAAHHDATDELDVAGGYANIAPHLVNR